MAAKSTREDFAVDVVLLSGPPYSGKSLYYKQSLSGKYERLCPAEIYRENPEYGVRDVCLQIYGYLKKNKKVVIEDDTDQPFTRKAYFTATKKKSRSYYYTFPRVLESLKMDLNPSLPDLLLDTRVLVPALQGPVVKITFPQCRMKLTEIHPEYGELQCEWTQQFVMGGAADNDEGPQDKQAQIQKWFLTQSSSPSKERTQDGVTVEIKTLPLTAVSSYKLEVPALFLQWEALYLDKNNTTPVAELCQNWAEHNSCGRIIVVCDGRNVSKGLLSQKEEDFAVKTFLQAVVMKVNVPIYVVQVQDLCKAGSFCLPPEPGLLAFLQKRHHLDLHCRATQYVYTSSSHKAMAEKAGVRHIKISQVLHRPNLLISGHSSTTPRIPDLLKHLVVEQDVDEQTAEIPLYGLTDDLTDGHIRVKLPGGRTESIFAKDEHIIHDYQNNYASYATPVGEDGSRIQNLQHSVQDKSLDSSRHVPSLPDVPTLSSDSSTGSTGSSIRGLPSWMLGKSKQSPSASLSKSDSTSSTEGRGRTKQTVYIMSEQELLETAKQILKQGGREDLIALLERQRKEKETEQTSDAIHTNKKAKHVRENKSAANEGEDIHLDDMLAVPTLSVESSPRKRKTQTVAITGHSVGGASEPSPAKKIMVSADPKESTMGVGEIAVGSDAEDKASSEDDHGDKEDEESRRKHISAVLDFFD